MIAPLRVLAALLLAGFVISAFDTPGREASRDLPDAERVAIEALISRLESMKEAKFVRNGKAYPAETAGKFLRAKWKHRADAVRSADDFINKVATGSSTTGRPYLVRHPDGRETPTAPFLRAELQRIRKAGSAG